MWLEHRSPTLIGLLKAAAVCTVVFSLTTFADPWHRYFELFSHFRLQYLVVALILALLLAVTRQRHWAAAMAVVSIINALPVVPWYVTDSTIPAGINTQIHILFANVNRKNSNIQALIELAEAEQPDLIVLQEVSNRWATAMDAWRSDYSHRQVIPRDDSFGIAVYARQAFVKVEVIDSPPFGFPSLVVQQNIGGIVVNLVSTHPVPPLRKQRFEARNEQLADIGVRVTALDGPTLLIGDLNTAMWGHHYEMLIGRTGLRNARDGFGVIPTWPTQLPFAMIPIDHCLVSNELAVLDIRSGPAIGSDHLPLIVTLGLL